MNIDNPHKAYLYAKNVIGKRWKEGEKIILTDAWSSYYYAFEVIKGRWKQAENIILTSKFASALYAKNIIKGRWVEAENIICTDPDCILFYMKNLEHVPEHLHNALLMYGMSNSNSDSLKKYFKK